MKKQRVTTGINGHDDSEEHCISLDTRAQWLQYVCAEVAKELQLYLTCVLCSAMLLSTPVAKTALLERSLMPQSPFPTKQPWAMIHAAGIPGSHSLHSQLPGANTNTRLPSNLAHINMHIHTLNLPICSGHSHPENPPLYLYNINAMNCEPAPSWSR